MKQNITTGASFKKYPIVWIMSVLMKIAGICGGLVLVITSPFFGPYATIFLLGGIIGAILVWILSNYLVAFKTWSIYIVIAMFAFCELFLIDNWINESHPAELWPWLWWYLVGTMVFVGSITYLLSIRKKFHN